MAVPIRHIRHITALLAVTAMLQACGDHDPSDTATLSWVAPSTRIDGTSLQLSEIMGYRIYHGTSAGGITQLADLDDPTAETYEVTGLPSGPNYFAITTYDVYGIESPMSELVSKTIQ